MNYNPIKLQNDLRLIPTATLIQYVQGMNPEVPSYMALGVLKERKEMEAKYEAENQKAPESSVAEDLTQAPQGGLQMLAGNPMGNQAQPDQAPQGAPTMPADQGVASLDTGDMFNEQNFASGGIVAFDDGGEVDYAGGGMVAFDNGGPVATSKFGDFFRGLGNRGALDIDKQIGALQAEKNKISYDIFSAYTPEQRATQQQRLAAIDAQIAALSEQRSSTANMPRVEKPALAAPGLAGLNTSPTVDNKLTNEDIANLESYRKQGTPRSEVMPTTPVADVTKPAAGPAPTPREAGIESLLEDTDGVAEKRMARYKQMVGEDPERGRLEELARKYETGAAEQERMAPWMALAKAGFSMAGGKSPFAIQNISEGAQAGLADYVQARDKLDKLTEKQIDIRTKMQQARRAEDIAGATYGLNSEAAVEARNAQVKLKDLEEKNAFARTKYSADVSTKNAMIAAARKSDFETFLSLAEKDDDNYKTVKDKDGNVKKIFDAGKVTQIYKSFGPSGSTDKEFLEQYERLSMLDKDFKKKYPTAADYVLDQKARLSGASAPAANSAGFSNLRISK
jgi:hypothetical protein